MVLACVLAAHWALVSLTKACAVALFCILAARNEQLAKVLGPSPVLLPKKLKTKHLHVTDQCLATTELAREVALLRTNWE